MSITKTRGEAVTFLNTSHDYPGLAGHAVSNRAICCNVLARCLPSSPFARERSADMSETLKAWREKSLHQRTDIADDHPSLERICVTLETATRKYAAMKADLREKTHELRLLQHRHQDILTHAKLEVFRRKNAERQAANLREQLERVQNQLHSEVAAREASESARRAVESDAARYKDRKRAEQQHQTGSLKEQLEYLQTQLRSEIAAREASEYARLAADSGAARYGDLYRKAIAECRYAQCIAKNKEKEMVAMEARPTKKVEGGFRSLQCRLDDARRGTEMDQEQSLIIRLAMERLLARETGSVPITSQMPSGNVHQRRQNVEPGPTPQVMGIDGGSAWAARASGQRVEVRAQLLQAQLLEFRLQGGRQAWNDVA